jgi:hypothetical protein
MYFCPCCGYQTLYERSPGTYLVCPICFWEDTEEPWGLHQAQLNFVSFGACEREWLKQVRHPTEQDKRDPNWQYWPLLDEKIKADGAKIIQQVISAFKGVKREDGISLHEAHQIYLVLDDYFDIGSVESSKARLKATLVESKAILAEAKARDRDTDWQEIPDESLKKFLDFMSIFYYYLDPKGWRYYLPAYIVLSLRQYIDQDCTGYLQSAICDFLLQEEHEVLDRAQQDLHQRTWSEYFTLLTKEQLTAVCQFLQFVINYFTGSERKEAQPEMEQHWKNLCQSKGDLLTESQRLLVVSKWSRYAASLC